MDDPRTDAPQLELSSPAADPAMGEDALQVGPADLPPAVTDGPADPFAMHLADAKPAETKAVEPAKLTKPAKPVTAAANDSVVAALMGRPIAKSSKSVAKTKAKTTPMTPDAPPPATPSASKPGIEGIPETPLLDAPIALKSMTPEADTGIVMLDDSFVSPEARGVDTPPPVVPATAEIVLSGVIHAQASVDPVAVEAARPVEPPAALPSAAPVFPKPRIAPTPRAVVPAMRPSRRAVPVAPAWPTVAPIQMPPSSAIAKPAAAIPSPAARPRVPASVKAQPVAATVVAKTPADVDGTPVCGTGAWWTIPLTFVGIAIVACAMLIPAADQNRRDAYELLKMERDVAHLREQASVNADFLRRVDTDPTLAERLAMRTLHQTRQGVAIAPLGGKPDRFGSSPYAMTRVDPPAPLPPYTPMPGRLSDWFLGEKRPQQMAALGLLVAGAGVLIGGRRKPESALV